MTAQAGLCAQSYPEKRNGKVTNEDIGIDMVLENARVVFEKYKEIASFAETPDMGFKAF